MECPTGLATGGTMTRSRRWLVIGLVALTTGLVVLAIWRYGQAYRTRSALHLLLTELRDTSSYDDSRWQSALAKVRELSADEAAVKEVQPLLKDPSPVIRHRAIGVLFFLGSAARSAVPSLSDVVRDEREAALRRLDAFLVIRELSPRDAEVLQKEVDVTNLMRAGSPMGPR
jgi:HEAT repeat protein